MAQDAKRIQERERYLDHGHGQANQEYGFRAYSPLYKGLSFALNQAIHPLAREGEAKTKKSWNCRRPSRRRQWRQRQPSRFTGSSLCRVGAQVPAEQISYLHL